MVVVTSDFMFEGVFLEKSLSNSVVTGISDTTDVQQSENIVHYKTVELTFCFNFW
jgi:hypothetical protein